MAVRHVIAPKELFFSQVLTASAKVIWLALHLDMSVEPGKLLSPTRLAAMTHLARPTIYRSLRLLMAQGWYPWPQAGSGSVRRELPGNTVAIPAEVVTAADLTPQAKVVYGAMQAMPGSGRLTARCTYAELATEMHLSYKTVKHAVSKLLEIGWVIRLKKGRKSTYAMQETPITPRCQGELVRVQNRLDRFDKESGGKSDEETMKHYGEILAQELATLVVDSDKHMNNAWPAFLINPKTKERMEFDWYLPDTVALEFHGPQHDHPTEWYSAEEVAKQQQRDRIKAQICEKRKIALVVIRPFELCLETVMKKLGQYVPLRDLRGEGPLVSLLEHRCRLYRNIALEKGWANSTEHRPLHPTVA